MTSLKRSSTATLMASLLALMALLGCTRVSENESQNSTSPILLEEAPEDMVILVLDTSGSFAPFMLNDGKAWNLATRIVDGMFRARQGHNDQLVIAQVSGNDSPLLWQGKPQQLRQAFSSASDFRAFVLGKSDMKGSRIYDGISDAVDFCLNDSRAKKSKRAALLICSDMIDTTPNREQAETRLIQSLATFGKQGGVVAMYWVSVHPDEVSRWRRNLDKAGIKGIVESSIAHEPTLPKW